MATNANVVIVGGGIAGASLACALASAGLGVVVLESSTTFRDRVRGESMAPWGVKEARTLGVEQLLLDAGAHVAAVWKQYSEGESDPFEIPMGAMVPEIPGTLNLAHPVACQTLLDAAGAAGAGVVRGVEEVAVTAGATMEVSYTAGSRARVACELVVGADGRNSVVRRQSRIELQRQDPVNYIAGLLVEGLDAVPDDHDAWAREGDVSLLVFHQGASRARLYLIVGDSDRQRFAGRRGSERFRSSCALECFPWSAQLAQGAPAGPCATYPGDDTWTSTPYSHGVVLVGDAAGHNDPIIGQGLSIALRDVRIVRDLVLEGARKPEDFTSYGQERAARMERLRLIADIFSAQSEDSPNRAARRAYVRERLSNLDPEWFPLLAGAFSGPETIPDECVRPELLDQVRSA
jgi:2-polyprenyl-6-methoxyphenol hydroxylase-like FAD-dependent oxidoreductase